MEGLLYVMLLYCQTMPLRHATATDSRGICGMYKCRERFFWSFWPWSKIRLNAKSRKGWYNNGFGVKAAATVKLTVYINYTTFNLLCFF